MKKTVLTTVLAATCALMAVGFSACGKDGQNGVDGKDGANGVDGKDGVSVSKAEINEEGELIITLSNGNFTNVGKVVGADGKDGENGVNGNDGGNGKDGNGVVSASFNADGELILLLTDGNTLNAGKVPTTSQEGAHTHSFLESAFIRNDRLYHTYVCDGCGEIVQEKHVYEPGGESCTVCYDDEGGSDGLIDYETGMVYDLNEEGTGYVVRRSGDWCVYLRKEVWIIPATFNGLPVVSISDIRVGYIKEIVISENVTNIAENVFDGRLSNELTAVYYKGTEAEWNEIVIGSNNDNLLTATRYYYSETEKEGCWYYKEGKPTLW